MTATLKFNDVYDIQNRNWMKWDVIVARKIIYFEANASTSQPPRIGFDAPMGETSKAD